MIQKRVTKAGKVRWRAVVRLVTAPTVPPEAKVKTFDYKAEAEQWHAETESRIRRERAGLSAPATRSHLSSLVEQYLTAKHSRAYATSKDRAFHLKWWVEALNDPQAARVRGAQVRRGLAMLECGPKTRNRYLSSLSSFYRWLIRTDLVEQNPCSGVERESETGHVIRFLTDEERKALLAAVHVQAASFVAFYLVSLWTGGRFSEVLGLRWRDIDTARQLVYYPATKGGRARAVPATAEVLAALAKLETRGPDEPVFPHFSRRAWRKALKASKVARFRWHDLRHSFCSDLIQKGVPLADVQQMAGHKSIATTLRYAHLAPSDAHDRVRAALNSHAAPSPASPEPIPG